MRRSGLAASFRYCVALLPASVAFAGFTNEANAESIRARVRLFGACADTEALAGELARRGVALEVLAPDAEAAPLVVALVVDVAPSGAHRAAFTLLDAGGARDDRTFQARNCSEIRAAAAWVLISLVRERDALRETPTPSRPAVASFPEEPASAPPETPRAPETPVRDPGPTSARPDHAAAPRPLRLGTAFVVGLGMTDELAFGALISAEYAALPFLGVRLSASSLSASDIRAEEAVAAIDRRVLSLSAVFRPESVPLWLSLGVEAGLLTAGARGLSRSDDDSAGWFALPLLAGTDVPLFTKVLELHLAGGVALSASPYDLKASGDTLVSTSPLEIRTEFGLSSRF